MRYGYAWIGVSVLCLAALGCSRGGPAPTTSETPQPSPTQTANTEPVRQAIQEFLEAVRTGDGPKAESLFTALARKKMAEMPEPIQVAPKASDTAKFEIGEIHLLDDDGARAPCRWTDLDKEGASRTDEMTWMLRKEPEGWRVAGMAAVVFEGEDPILLDFENPAETLQKLVLLREEIRHRMEKPIEQAQQPEKKSDESILR